MKNCPICQLTYPDQYSLCPHDGGKLEESKVWTAGTIVRDKYKIIGRIGAGGMATVYQAEHVHFHELRALKVITESLSGDDAFVRRFMQEAVLTRRLQHPNAVRVDDIDRAEDGRPFIVMEYLEGMVLKDAIKPQTPMPVDEACRIAKQVASALGAAHKMGLVHRDIKPANIFLISTPQGTQAKVLDFGIAKVKEARLEDSQAANLTLTGKGMVIGTPAYMSPEQAAGKRGDELDGRSDLYSLGVVFYQMLTGDLPLWADSELHLLMAHLSTEPVPIQQRLPSLPPLLAYTVMRCLAKDPAQRPQDAEAFIKEIEDFEASNVPTPQPVIPVIPDKPKQPPTRPHVPVDYATNANAKPPFFTKTKAFALAAVLLVVAGLSALGVRLRTHHPAVVNPPVQVANVPTQDQTPAPAVKESEIPPAIPEAQNNDIPDAKDPTSTDVKDAVKDTPAPVSKPTVPKKVVPSPTKSYADTAPPMDSGNGNPKANANSTPTQTASNDPWAVYSNGGSSPKTAQTQPVPNNPPPSSTEQSMDEFDKTIRGNSSAGPSGGVTPRMPNGQMNQGQPNQGAASFMPPMVIFKVDPKYPQQARPYRISGASVLDVTVDANGIPFNIRVVRAAGYGLDQQAVEAIRRWRFRPGSRNGTPVNSHVGVQVNFHFAGLFSFAKSSVVPGL